MNKGILTSLALLLVFIFTIGFKLIINKHDLNQLNYTKALDIKSRQPPGVIVDYSRHSSGIYLGSPSIVIIDEGVYLAKCEETGHRSTRAESGKTRIYKSIDAGRTWSKISTVDGLYWANIFRHNNAVYMIGTDKVYGNAVIVKSVDKGITWSKPNDRKTGLLFDGMYHTAAVPIVIHDGRIWRSMEKVLPGVRWGANFQTFVMSAPVDSDLLNCESWKKTNILAGDSAWLDGRFGGWLEGNVVVNPGGEIVNILRVQFGTKQNPFSNTWSEYEGFGKAAIVKIKDENTALFNPEKDFIEFPGGLAKFSIRWDTLSEYYWSITNYVPPVHRNSKKNSERIRNTLTLIRSKNLRSWEIRDITLYESDPLSYGFQYADWCIEGEDIIFVSRTFYPDSSVSDDSQFTIDRAHDANYITFHRIKNFREIYNFDQKPWSKVSD